MINKDLFEDDYELAERVKVIIGIPKVMLDDQDIASPTYKRQANKYIYKKLSEIFDKLEKSDMELVKTAYTYYVAYLIAPSMYIRLPQKMENISTKTTMQDIDWYKFADEMLKNCDEILDDLLEDYGIESVLGLTMVDLSDVAEYPNEIM